MVMISAGRLDMSVVGVQAEVDEPGLRFIIPLTQAIPKFSSARFERDSVQRDAEPGTVGGTGLRGRLGAERETEFVSLRGKRVGVPTIGELAWLVIGPAIGYDQAFATGHRDGDVIRPELGNEF